MKNWQLIVITFSLLWLYRLFADKLAESVLAALAWLLWLVLTGLFALRASRKGASPKTDSAELTPIFPPLHVLARCAASAALVVGVSSLFMVQNGSILAVWVLLLVVLVLVCYGVSGIRVVVAEMRQSGRSPKPLARWLDVWLPVGFAALLARELRILGYAFWPGRKPKEGARKDFKIFSNHFVARPLLMAVLALGVVELAIVHIFLRALPQWIIAMHLVIGTLFIVYIIGIIRAFTSLPTRIDNGVLQIRMSVFFKATALVEDVRGVSRILAMPDTKRQAVANAAILVSPNVLLELAKPIWIDRLFKPPSQSCFIALYVDDPAGFVAALTPSCT